MKYLPIVIAILLLSLVTAFRLEVIKDSREDAFSTLLDYSEKVEVGEMGCPQPLCYSKALSYLIKYSYKCGCLHYEEYYAECNGIVNGVPTYCSYEESVLNYEVDQHTNPTTVYRSCDLCGHAKAVIVNTYDCGFVEEINPQHGCLVTPVLP